MTKPMKLGAHMCSIMGRHIKIPIGAGGGGAMGPPDLIGTQQRIIVAGFFRGAGAWGMQG